MNGKWLALALMVLGSTSWAQVGELYNAEITEYTRSGDPASAAARVEDGWLAFSMPVLEGTQSPCCWSGRWNGKGEVGCSLAAKHTSYGSRSDSPLTDTVNVYSRIDDGQVKKLRVFGPQCPVDGDGQKVTWLAATDQGDVLDWLQSLGESAKGDGALFALALHRSDDAAEHLYTLAKDARRDRGSEAVFWLGEARGEQGYGMLERLLDELPRGDTRREINFALAMNDSPEAAEKLFEISKTDKDPEQRGQALFWLAQEYPSRAAEWLLEVVQTERDDEVLEQAIFAISQLPSQDGSQMLLDIARDVDAPRQARRQALFWLAQSDDDEAIEGLAALLTR